MRLIPIMRPFPDASSLLRSIVWSGLPTWSSTLGIESPTLTIFAVDEVEILTVY